MRPEREKLKSASSRILAGKMKKGKSVRSRFKTKDCSGEGKQGCTGIEAKGMEEDTYLKAHAKHASQVNGSCRRQGTWELTHAAT